LVMEPSHLRKPWNSSGVQSWDAKALFELIRIKQD
jgi:hypothetical protein